LHHSINGNDLVGINSMTSMVSPMVTSSDNAINEVSPRNLSKQAWIVCLSAALFFFYEFIQMHMFNAINDSLRIAFNVDATQLGVLSSTYLWGDVAFLLPAGMLLDRFSTRTILLIALAVCIGGTAGFALTHSLPIAAFFHFLSGCGNAFCLLSCMMLVSRWFEPNRQAFVVGFVVTMAFFGGVIAQTPLACLADIVGWRMSLIYDSILGCIFLVLIYWNVKDYPQNHIISAKARKSTSFFKALGTSIKNIQNILAGVYTCLLNLPIMVLDAVWGVTYLKTVYGLSNMQASNVTAMIFFGSMIACPLAGFLSDRMERRRMPMILGAILSLVMVSLVVFVPHLSYISLLILFFLIGFFTSTQIISYPFAAESNPSVFTGTAVGLVSLIVIGGAAIAQIAFGKLLDLNWDGAIAAGQKIYSVSAYHNAMIMFPVVMGIGLLASLCIKETYCKKRED
jgi:sugar phosphate permease